MIKKDLNRFVGFLSEHEGQIRFFSDLKISTDVELIHNTDGVYKGTLLEFKLTIFKTATIFSLINCEKE